MKSLTPIFSTEQMLFCSCPVPNINAHKGSEFSFTQEQIAHYGQSQTHPSLMYAPNGWNGHKYWLATTPYPFADAVFENACIYYGDEDGSGNPPRVFTPISGTASGDYSVVDNPIVKITANNAINSDPDLWLDSDTNLLWMVSRDNRNHYGPYPQKSQTGMAWTPRGGSPLWLCSTGELAGKPEFLSPAIVKVGNSIRIYCLSGTAGSASLNEELNRGRCWGVYVMQGTTLEGAGDFAFIKKASLIAKNGIECWHMDIFADSRTGYLYMVVSARNNLTDTTDVYLAESTDGWNFTLFARPLISGGYSHYRPTAALREDGELVVYFSVTNAPSSAASYPNGSSDVPVDGRAIGVVHANFDEILADLRMSKVYGWQI